MSWPFNVDVDDRDMERSYLGSRAYYDLAAKLGCFSEDPMSLSTTRPSTSKPRGVCRYYTQPRGCFAADKCKFLHGEPPIEAKPDDPPMLTPYDKAKRCVFYAQGLMSLALCDLFCLMACCQDFARGEMHAGSYMYLTGNLATILR